MAKQEINIGSAPNDNTGDLPRPAFQKVNENFTEVYDNLDNVNGGITLINEDLVTVHADLSAAQGSLSNLEASVPAMQSDVNGLLSDMDTAQADILALQSGRSIEIGVDISYPTMGYLGSVQCPSDGTIVSWVLVADIASSCVIDVRKTNYAGLDIPDTIGSSIAGSEKPALTNAKKNQDTNLTTWTPNVSAGDWISFYMESCSETANRVTLFLKVNL